MSMTRQVVRLSDKWGDRKLAGISLSVNGSLSPGANQAVYLVPVGQRLTVRSVSIAVTGAPASADLIVDINRNGSSLFATTPANRPTIPVGSTAATSGSPDVATLFGGDLITVDIDQGDGANLAVALNCILA